MKCALRRTARTRGTKTGTAGVGSVFLAGAISLSAVLTVMNAPPAAAESSATAYDLSIFLNEPYPFDTAAKPAAASPSPATDGAETSTGAAAENGGMALGDGDFALDGTDLGGAAGPASVNDPIEPVNRFIFGFNQIVEDVVLRPLAYTYNAVVPDPGRAAVSNFLDNLSSPVVLANDLLQGQPSRAWDTLRRMVINTTVGVGGLWDAAAYMGIEEHREDFGQTLAVWGVGEGFYMVLPILGPSNPRDALGIYGADMYLDPVGRYLENTDRDGLRYTRMGVTGLVKYADMVDQLDTLRSTSIDYYAAMRSFYRQNRKAEVENRDGADGAYSESGR